MSEMLEVILRSLEYGSIYALASLGIVLVYKTSYTANFAQGMIAVFSTYVVAKLVNDSGVNFYLAILCGILSAIFLGVGIDFLVIRPAKNVDPIGKQILTLGMTSILLGIAPMIFGVYNLNMPKFIQTGVFTILGAQMTYNGLVDMLIGFVAMVGMFYVLQKTKLGLAIKTTASNETVSRMMGVSTKNITMFSWATAGVFSLLSGIMAAPYSTVSLTFMNDILIIAFLACILGGFQTFYGAVIASYLIAVVLNLYQVYMPNGTVLGVPIVYALLLVVMYFKPYGLFGKEVVKKV